MGWMDVFWHLAGLVAPAVFVPPVVMLVARWLGMRPHAAMTWGLRLAIHWLVGAVVLVAGLILTGEDGRMVTYLVLVLAIASTEWLLVRGWRSG